MTLRKRIGAGSLRVTSVTAAAVAAMMVVAACSSSSSSSASPAPRPCGRFDDLCVCALVPECVVVRPPRITREDLGFWERFVHYSTQNSPISPNTSWYTANQSNW